MAPVLQCPDCGTKHPIDVASDAAAFRCSGCGRTLKVPEQFRAAPPAAAPVAPAAAATAMTEIVAPKPAARSNGQRTLSRRKVRAQAGVVPFPLRLLVWFVAVPLGFVIVFGVGPGVRTAVVQPARRRVPRNRLEPVLARGPLAPVRRAGHRVDRPLHDLVRVALAFSTRAASAPAEVDGAARVAHRATGARTHAVAEPRAVPVQAGMRGSSDAHTPAAYSTHTRVSGRAIHRATTSASSNANRDGRVRSLTSPSQSCRCRRRAAPPVRRGIRSGLPVCRARDGSRRAARARLGGGAAPGGARRAPGPDGSASRSRLGCVVNPASTRAAAAHRAAASTSDPPAISGTARSTASRASCAARLDENGPSATSPARSTRTTLSRGRRSRVSFRYTSRRRAFVGRLNRGRWCSINRSSRTAASSGPAHTWCSMRAVSRSNCGTWRRSSPEK